jgi:hypothetical protein
VLRWVVVVVGEDDGTEASAAAGTPRTAGQHAHARGHEQVLYLRQQREQTYRHGAVKEALLSLSKKKLHTDTFAARCYQCQVQECLADCTTMRVPVVTRLLALLALLLQAVKHVGHKLGCAHAISNSAGAGAGAGAGTGTAGPAGAGTAGRRTGTRVGKSL